MKDYVSQKTSILTNFIKAISVPRADLQLWLKTGFMGEGHI